MVTDMAVFKIGKFHYIIAQICHLFHWRRDEQQAGQTEHKSKRKTYEQKLDSEYVHVIHDYIYKMKTDNLWLTVGGLCAKHNSWIHSGFVPYQMWYKSILYLSMLKTHM